MQRTSGKDVFRQLQEAGGQVFLAGGCVRDALLGHGEKDLDVVVFGLEAAALQQELARFGQVLTYGRSFRIYQIKGLPVEFSLPRDTAPSSAMTVAQALQADARGRDFTINALYRHALTGELADPLNGLSDLRGKRLRMASPSAFETDPLRVYRAVQLISRMLFVVEPETKRAMKNTDTSGIPSERVHEELNKWLCAAEPQRGWELMAATGHVPEFVCGHLLSGVGEKAGACPVSTVASILKTASRSRDQSQEPLVLMWSALLAPVIIRSRHQMLAGDSRQTLQQQAVDWYKSFSRHHRRAQRVARLLRATEDFLRKTHRKPDVLRLCLLTVPVELELLVESLGPLWEHYGLQPLIAGGLRRFRQWKTGERIQPLLKGDDFRSLDYEDGPRMGIWLETAFQMQLEGVAQDDLTAFFRRYRDLLCRIQTSAETAGRGKV